MIFTQNTAKDWYTQSGCNDLHSNPGAWTSNSIHEGFSPNSQFDVTAPSYSVQPAVTRAQYIEPQPVSISHNLSGNSAPYLNECTFATAESELCSGYSNRFGATLAKSSNQPPALDIDTSESPSFRLDPIASFFPQVDIGGKATSAPVFDGNLTQTGPVASALANCQNFCEMTYQSEMDGITAGLSFQNRDSDTLSIATSVSDHGQDAVDVIA